MASSGESLAERAAREDENFHAIYGYSYDLVMVFRVLGVGALPTAMEQSWPIKKVLERLVNGGLQYRLFYSLDRSLVMCKIRAPLERLEQAARITDFAVLLDRALLPNVAQRGLVDTSTGDVICGPFRKQLDIQPNDAYSAYDYIYAPFRSRDCLRKLYKKMRVPGHPRSLLFSPKDRLKLMMMVLRDPPSKGGCGLDVHKLVASGAARACFPLHDSLMLAELSEKWLLLKAGPMKQPFDEIRDYFGEKVTLYFVFLGFFTRLLIPIAAVGVIVFICKMTVDSDDINDSLALAMGFLMALWSTVFNEAWARQNQKLVMKWGLRDLKATTQTRPEFEGDETPCPVRGGPNFDLLPGAEEHTVRVFDPAEKLRRVLFGVAVVTVLLAATVAGYGGAFAFKAWSARQAHVHLLEVRGFVLTLATVGGAISSILVTVQVMVLNYVFTIVARQLNDFENYRTHSAYEDALIVKVFSFQFINSYGTMFFIAFLKEQVGMKCVGGLGESSKLAPCMGELEVQLIILMLVRLLWGNFTEIGIPWCKRRRAMKRAQRERELGLTLREPSAAESEYRLEPYDDEGIFDDYQELVITYGYAVLFVIAFPLAPLIAVISNYVEIRVDAFKMLYQTRRPHPLSVDSIGSWANILQVMDTASVITNCLMIVQHTPLVKGYAIRHALPVGRTRVICFVLAEHVLLLMKTLVAFWGSTSVKLDRQIARQDVFIDRLFSAGGVEKDGSAIDSQAVVANDDNAKHTILFGPDDDFQRFLEESFSKGMAVRSLPIDDTDAHVPDIYAEMEMDSRQNGITLPIVHRQRRHGRCLCKVHGFAAGATLLWVLALGLSIYCGTQDLEWALGMVLACVLACAAVILFSVICTLAFRGW